MASFSFTQTTPNDMMWSFSSAATDNTTTTRRPPISADDLFLMILKTFPDYRRSMDLVLYGCSLQVALGTVTNLLTIAVMTRPALITSTTCFYFALLAIADLFVLYFTCLRKVLYTANDNKDVFLSTAWSCHFMTFLAYFSYDFSSWVLTVMTIDRFIAIRFPLRSASLCTIRNACISIAGVALLCVAKNCHFFFTFERTPRGGCLGKDAYTVFLDKAWPWIDAVFYSFLPFFLLLVFNVLIILCHRKALRQQHSLQAATSLSTSTHGSRLSSFNQRLTIMLLVVSFTFMVMTAPKVILFCIRKKVFKFFSDSGSINFRVIANYTLVSSIFDFLMWTNHTTNFFLYCLSGTRFRQEFLRMLSHWLLCLRCRRLSRVSASHQNGAHNHTSTQRSGNDSKRRDSTTSSVVSDDLAPGPAQLPEETEDAPSRVIRWATVTFGGHTATH